MLGAVAQTQHPPSSPETLSPHTPHLLGSGLQLQNDGASAICTGKAVRRLIEGLTASIRRQSQAHLAEAHLQNARARDSVGILGGCAGRFGSFGLSMVKYISRRFCTGYIRSFLLWEHLHGIPQRNK